MFTAPVLTPRLCPIARWLSPWANRSRSTSRIFRIDNLSPGIPFPHRSAKGQDYPWLKTVGSSGHAMTRRPTFMITGIGVHDPLEWPFIIN